MMKENILTVYDSRLNKKIRLIRPTEAHIEQLENGRNILIFSDLDEVLEKKQRVVVDEELEGSRHKLSIYTTEGIESIRSGDEISYAYYCEGIIYEMTNIYIDDRRFRQSTALQVFDAIFKYTNFNYKFEDNNMGAKAITTSFYHISAYTAFIDTLNKLGYYYEIEDSDKLSLNQTVIIKKDNKLSKTRITYGKNLTGATRRIKDDTIVNVLYPYGNSLEKTDEEGKATGGYTRKIDISTAKKSGGKKYVMDTESIEKWGRHEATMDFDTDDVDELYELAMQNLNYLKGPRIEYEVEVISDGDLYRVGDMVLVSDTELNILVTAKVVELQKDLLSGEFSVKLGHYEDIGITNKKNEERAMIDKLQNRLKELAANFNPSEGGESIAIHSVDGLQEILDRLELEIDTGKETYISKSDITKIRDDLNKKLSTLGGYVYMDEGKGVLTYDKPREENPTKVVQMVGGAIRFANKKDENGNWIYNTAITGDGINASAIDVNTLTTDILKYGDITLTQELKNISADKEKLENKTDGIITSVDEIRKDQEENNKWVTEEFTRVSTSLEDRFNSAVSIGEEKVLDLETKIKAGEIKISSVEDLKASVDGLAAANNTNLIYNGDLATPQERLRDGLKLLVDSNYTLEDFGDENKKVIKIEASGSKIVTIKVPYKFSPYKFTPGTTYSSSFVLKKENEANINVSIKYYGDVIAETFNLGAESTGDYKKLYNQHYFNAEKQETSEYYTVILDIQSATTLTLGLFDTRAAGATNNYNVDKKLYEMELTSKFLKFKEKYENIDGQDITTYLASLSARQLDFENQLEGYSSTLSAMDVKFTKADEDIASSLSALALSFNDVENNVSSSLSAQKLEFEKFSENNEKFKTSLDARTLKLEQQVADNQKAITEISPGMAKFVKEEDLGKTGTTIIDGGRLKTGKISSTDESTWINLEDGTFNFKDKLKIEEYNSPTTGETLSELIFAGVLKSYSAPSGKGYERYTNVEEGKISQYCKNNLGENGLEIYSEFPNSIIDSKQGLMINSGNQIYLEAVNDVAITGKKETSILSEKNIQFTTVDNVKSETPNVLSDIDITTNSITLDYNKNQVIINDKGIKLNSKNNIFINSNNRISMSPEVFQLFSKSASFNIYGDVSYVVNQDDPEKMEVLSIAGLCKWIEEVSKKLDISKEITQEPPANTTQP